MDSKVQLKEIHIKNCTCSNSLPMEETLTFHNPIILIKSAVNKNENNYHYIFRKKFI